MAARSRDGTMALSPLRLALALWALPVGAQRAVGSPWTVVAPDAALAWFTVLADWRVDGSGALPFISVGSGPGTTDVAQGGLARQLRSDPARDVLHFVPLYHPSAQRADLAAALRATATSASAPTARATFLVSALVRTLPAAQRRAYLPALADALERSRHTAPDGASLRFLQQRLDSVYLPALAGPLAAERLDAGRLIIAPALGPEGRIFAATDDRADNLVAVSAFSGDPDAEAPLLAFVREACYPRVSRAAASARLGADSPNAARRASIAAVRCGAELMDACLADRAAPYRRLWLRQATRHGLRPNDTPVPQASPALRAEFDRVFPRDAVLAVRVDCTRTRP